MSTFIYTLQRKVQELQNTLRHLHEQNYQLKNRARMLSEAAPPGPPPGGTPEVTGVEQITQTYGGLGSSAFLTRTTNAYDRNSVYWSGWQFSNGYNNLFWPLTWEEYLRLRLDREVTIPSGNSTVSVFYDSSNPSTSVREIARWVIANMMLSTDFNPANFSSGAEFLSHCYNVVQELGNSGLFSPQVTQAYLRQLDPLTQHEIDSGSSNFLYTYFVQVWNDIMRTGTFDTSSPTWWNPGGV